MHILVPKGQHKYYSFMRNLQQSNPLPKLKAYEVTQNTAYLPLTATNKFSHA